MVDNAKSALDQIAKIVDAERGTPQYDVLPGNDFARYAIPIEYMPSRDLRPRWGNTRPLIPQLADRFRSEEASYSNFMNKMRIAAGNLSDIPHDYIHGQLPTPAWFGVPFCAFDSVALYTMIQDNRPKRYLEIGSGISTCFAYRAIKDFGLDTEIISIDPEPRGEIDNICTRVLRHGLEVMDFEIFDDLESGDILFFDGSHRTFMNSDVTVFFIDVLPKVKPGVLIHIHDIALPWDYDRMFVNWYWNEQYMLATYMMAAGSQIEVVLPTSWACRSMSAHPFFTKPTLDLGERHDALFGGGSMWFKRR